MRTTSARTPHSLQIAPSTSGPFVSRRMVALYVVKSAKVLLPPVPCSARCFVAVDDSFAPHFGQMIVAILLAVSIVNLASQVFQSSKSNIVQKKPLRERRNSSYCV